MGDERVVIKMAPVAQMARYPYPISRLAAIRDLGSKDVEDADNKPAAGIIDIEDLSSNEATETKTSTEAMATYIESLEQQVAAWGSWGKGMLGELDRYEGIETTVAEGKAGYKRMQLAFRSERAAYNAPKTYKRKATLKMTTDTTPVKRGASSITW